MRLSRGGKLPVTDGPFTESKEVIGGYDSFVVHSREEAVNDEALTAPTGTSNARFAISTDPHSAASHD